MPGGDGTGPMGSGPMTGRGAGFCAETEAPDLMNRRAGRGSGYGRGFSGGMGRGFRCRGQGFGNRYQAMRPAGGWALFTKTPWRRGDRASFIAEAPTRQGELEALKQQAGYLEQSLSEIRKRLGELEAEAGKENE
ncbi:MAG: DUF5320 domain-containing protein [Planctomycetota bacterium]